MELDSLFLDFVKILLVGLLLGILAVGSASGTTMIDEARKRNWQTHNLESLKVLFSEKASVSAFIRDLNKELYPALLDVEFEPTLCEYELTDLNHDGTVELVATLSHSRAFCNTIFVIQNNNGVFQTFEIRGGGFVKDLKSRIVDLNHDGVKELLVPRLLAPYDGATPIPIIDDVYEWDGAGYSKANDSFKDYYRNLLPRLKSELEAVRQGEKLDVPSDKALLEKKYEMEIKEVNNILSE
jgi:hypothetical protein